MPPNISRREFPADEFERPQQFGGGKLRRSVFERLTFPANRNHFRHNFPYRNYQQREYIPRKRSGNAQRHQRDPTPGSSASSDTARGGSQPPCGGFQPPPDPQSVPLDHVFIIYGLPAKEEFDSQLIRKVLLKHATCVPEHIEMFAIGSESIKKMAIVTAKCSADTLRSVDSLNGALLGGEFQISLFCLDPGLRHAADSIPEDAAKCLQDKGYSGFSI